MSAKQAAGPRLSEKQREFLGKVAAHEAPTDDFPDGTPLYLSHTFMAFEFNYESERDRWVQNLEARGFVTIRNRNFVRLTDAGRSAIAHATGSTS